MQGSYQYKAATPVKKEEGEAPKQKEAPPRQITPWDMITPQVQSTNLQKIDQGKPMMGQGQGQMQNDLYNPYSLL